MSASHVQEQANDDCVIVTNVVQASKAQSQTNEMLEHQFKSTFKHKGQFLLKLLPNRGWVKIKETKDLFLTKVVQTMDETALIIGGASDRNSSNTLSEVSAFFI